MILNELLTKQKFLNNILLKNGNKELSKELKMKIILNRVNYSKIRDKFDEEVQNFIQTLSTNEIRQLQNKSELSDEEKNKLEELSIEANDKYSKFLSDIGNKNVEFFEEKLTYKDFEEIVEVNADNDVEINNNKLSAAYFLEVFYTLFIINNEN